MKDLEILIDLDGYWYICPVKTKHIKYVWKCFKILIQGQMSLWDMPFVHVYHCRLMQRDSIIWEELQALMGTHLS